METGGNIDPAGNGKVDGNKKSLPCAASAIDVHAVTRAQETGIIVVFDLM